MNVRNQMRSQLDNDIFSELSDMNKEEIVESLYVYHEELMFQNNELRETNQRILSLEKQSDRLFDLAPTGLMILDDDLNILRINQFVSLKLPQMVQNEKFSKYVDIESQDQLYFLNRKLSKLSMGNIGESFIKENLYIKNTLYMLHISIVNYQGKNCYYVAMC